MIRLLRLAFWISVFTVALTSCTTRTATPARATNQDVAAPNAININTASAKELERIPHIGPQLAGKIISFREGHGPFRRPEHLMLIRGFSDTRYREIKAFIKTE